MLSEILQSLPAGVLATDAEGRIVFFNEGLVALLGRRPAIGAGRWEALPLSHPDGRPMQREESALARALAGGAPVRVSAMAARPDGRQVQIGSLAAPVRDGDGGLTGAVEVMLEADELRGPERTAADLDQARLAAIVASSDDAIISKTLDGVVTSWNAGATRIFGYEPEEMIGQSILRIIPPELRAEEETILSRLRRGERVDHFDTERVGKDGRRVFVSLTVSPVRNSAGVVVGASKVARDVTERKRAEEMQRLLLGELNHRVKNTLAIIQAIARQSLRLEPNPGAFVASFTGRVQALARAHDILLQRRDAAGGTGRPGARAGRFRRPRPPHQLDGTEGGARTRAPRCSWRWCCTSSRRTRASTARSRRRQGGSPSAGARSRPMPGGTSWCSSGGKPASAAQEAPASQGFGTLLIERSLLASGGRTAIRYLPDGFACEIRLRLARAGAGRDRRRRRRSPGGEAGREPAPDPHPLAGVRILVVEDEPLIAMDIEERLLAAGGNVIGPAANPETARRLIAETAPDAALLDANLAGSRVDDLAVELRRRRIPFAFATGFGRESLPREFAGRAGARQALRVGAAGAMVRALLAGREGAGSGGAESRPPPSIAATVHWRQGASVTQSGARSAVEKSRGKTDEGASSKRKARNAPSLPSAAVAVLPQDPPGAGGEEDRGRAGRGADRGSGGWTSCG